jgi:hypothetical protein
VPTKSRIRAIVYGAVAGGFLGLLAMVVFGGRFGLEAAVATPVSEGSPRASIDFVASSGGLYLVVLAAGFTAGLVIAGIAYAVGRESEPDSPKFPLHWFLPVAGFTAAIAAYTAMRTGVALMGDIEAGIVTISVFSLAVVIVVSGGVAGAITSYIVDLLARPDMMGFGGAAFPRSTSEAMGAMGRAIGLPVLAVVIGGIFAVGLAQILLETSGTMAVILFSLAGAIVLGGAALIAYRPWERGGDSSAG